MPALANVAVSLYLPGDTGPPTVHADGLHTAYVAPGNEAASATIKAGATTTAYLWLAAIDVVAPAGAGGRRDVRRLDYRRRWHVARRESGMGVAARGDTLEPDQRREWAS